MIDFMSTIISKLNESINNDEITVDLGTEDDKFINESGEYNPGNLLIGQTIPVRITDAKGNQFMRDMEVGDLLAGGQVEMKDNLTGQVIYLQFETSYPQNGIKYAYRDEDTGVSYFVEINTDKLSNEPTTKLD